MTTLNMHLPVCASQIACDGARIRTGNTICYKCRDKMAKRNKPPPPLRGEHTELTRSERKERE